MGINDERGGGPEGPSTPEWDEAQLGRLVASYVRSIEVPRGLTDTDWRAARRPTVRWVGWGSGRTTGLGSLAAFVVVASLVAAVAVFGLTGRTPLPGTASMPPNGPSAQVIPSPMTVESGAASPTPVSTAEAPSLAKAAWFSMFSSGGCPASAPSEPLSGCSGSSGSRPGYLELYVGTLDGNVTGHFQRSLPASAGLWVGRGSLPDAAGPFGGLVLYNFFDGTSSELHVVDATTGRDATAVTTDNVIYDAVVDTAANVLYFGQLDPAHRRDLGVWRIDLEGTGTPERFLPPAQGLVYTGPQEWHRALYVTPDGRRLVVHDCQQGSCEVAIYETSGGQLVASADGLRDDAVFGVTNDALVGVLRCDGADCAIGTLDLASGQLEFLTTDPCALSGSGVLANRANGQPVLLVSSSPGASCQPSGSVLAIDLVGSPTATVWKATATDPGAGAKLALAFQAQGSQGYAAPAGWFLLAPNEELAHTPQSGSLMPVLVSLSDGTAIPLSVRPTFDH